MATTNQNDLLALAEYESDDPEYIPEIIPVDARISVRGSTDTILTLFYRANNIAPVKEVIAGSGNSQLEAIAGTSTETAHLRLTISNGEQSLSVVAEGIVVSMAGSVLLPTKKIFEILKNAPDKFTKIEVFGSTATIRSGRAQWTVQIPVGTALPPLPNIDKIALTAVKVAPFLKALKVARAAASTAAARPSLMQLHVAQGAITGTDAGRLHRQVVEGFNQALSFDIPVKAADELMRALRNAESDQIELGFSDFYIVVHVDQDFLIIQRLLVAFPNIDQLILGPAFSNTHKLVVNRQNLVDVIKRIRVNSDPDYAAIFLTPVPGKPGATGVVPWNLAVRSRDRVGNAAQELLDVQWDGGTIPELCVNHKYLTEFLLAYESEDCIFRIGDDTKSQRNPLFVEDKVTGFTGFVQQMSSF